MPSSAAATPATDPATAESGRPAPGARHPRTKPSPAPGGLPLGPSSLTWKIFGDARGLIIVGRTGVLQTMHPTISQALLGHSDYFTNPLDRLLRSAAPILGVVYDEEHGDTSAWVRDRHKGITGEHPTGKRYRALDPDAFWWAHATFFESQIARCALFATPLTLAEKEQLYRETITWYSRYGLTMRVVPPSYAAFEEYWAHMFADVLEATPVAMSALEYAALPSPFAALEGVAWGAIGPFVSRGGPWITRGTLPPEAQAILGVKPSRVDDAALRALRTGVRGAWPLLPAAVRRLGVAHAADMRVGWSG